MNELIRGVDVDLLNKAYNELYSAVLEQKKRLGKLLENLDPLEVMLRAVWHSRLLVLLRSGNPDDFDGRDPVDELSCNKTNLIPEYLQSCLLYISAGGRTSCEDDMAAGRLEEMMSCTELIVDQLNKGIFVRFLDAFITGKEAGMSEGVLDYQIEAMAYQSVRGQRYQAVSEAYLSLLLCKQDSLIRRVYGIGCVEVVKGFDSLMKSLTMGWSEAMQNLETQLENYQERGCAALDDIDKDEATIIAESVFGHRLHDVLTVTNWPEELINDLSLPVACTSDFKAFESINPLGLMPVVRKPFIRIAGKSYCFCAANLLDNFYRAFYQAIRSRYESAGLGSSGEFIRLWKEQQALASEEGVAGLVEALLPGADICVNAFHPNSGTQWSKRDSRESDLVVLYGDALLAIEVKAGAFCSTDPVNDLGGHVKSFKALLEKASRQAESTVEYVRRCCGETCRFYDASGQVKFEFSPKTVRTVFKICVSVDDFNAFTSKADKLDFIEMTDETIALSLDDLLVYSEYFDNPLSFLHFLTQRRAATAMPALYMNDELDHLGMYIASNCYVKALATEAKECDFDFENDPKVRIQGFFGFREPIDRWFEDIYAGIGSAKPVQESPQVFNQIIAMLNDAELGYWRRAAASTLLNCGFETRKEISNGIAARLRMDLPSDLLFELSPQDPTDVPLCIFVNRVDRPNNNEICRRKCWALLLHDAVSLVVRMDINVSQETITSLSLSEYRAENLSEADKSAALEFVDALDKTRKYCIRKQVGRKIGRNEPCPCGSGKKYKRCCGK